MSVVSPPQSGYPHNSPKTGGLQESKSVVARPAGAVTSQSRRAHLDAPPFDLQAEVRKARDEAAIEWLERRPDQLHEIKQAYPHSSNALETRAAELGHAPGIVAIGPERAVQPPLPEPDNSQPSNSSVGVPSLVEGRAEVIGLQPGPEPANDDCILIDPRTALKALRAGEDVLLLIRMVAQTLSDDRMTTEGALRNECERRGICYGNKHWARLMEAGQGNYWDLLPDGRLFYVGYKRISVRLTQNTDHPALDKPGGKRVWIPVSRRIARKLGHADYTAETWRALLMCAFIATKGADWIVSNHTLANISGAGIRTIQRWKRQLRRAGLLSHKQVEAQTDELDPERIPDRATSYVALEVDYRGKRKATHWRWQLPNAYTAKLVVHAHKGQARKVRGAVNTAIREIASDPPNSSDGGSMIERRYFDDAAAQARYTRRRGTGKANRYTRQGYDHDRNIIIVDQNQVGNVRTYINEFLSLLQGPTWGECAS